MNFRLLLLGSASALAIVSLGLIFSTSASATINMPPGDWVISDLQVFADETIIVNSTNASNGNILITPTGDLRLENVTVLVPFNRTFDVQGALDIRNSTVRGPNWFFWLRGVQVLQNVELINATHDTGMGRSGTYIQTQNTTLENVRWNRSNLRVSWIHMRVPLDFQGHYLGFGGALSYELPSLSGSRTIDISRNRFFLSPGFGLRTTAIAVTAVQHTGFITYDIHDNEFRDGTNGIYVGASSASTTYNVRDNRFTGPNNVVVEFGVSADRFGGLASLWNLSISSCNWAMSLYGVAGAGVSVSATNISISGCMNGIAANEADFTIRSSWINSTSPQYEARTNGHFYIYDTFDTAFVASTPGTGGSVEHFALLNLDTMTWQGAVPILGDLVTFRNGTGLVFLTLDPRTWTPGDIVWWGMYNGLPSVDNRDLRPVILDGPATFDCSPAQFFVSPGMAPFAIVCTDDLAPSISATAPSSNWIQNTTDLLGSGNVAEYGSGIASLDWSVDSFTFTPVTFAANSTTSWSFVGQDLPDGIYLLTIRGTDRTGNVAFVTRSNLTIDTTAPTLTLTLLPPYYFATTLDLSGVTEPAATVTVTRVGGWTASAVAAANGTFSIAVPLEEGQNLFTVIVRDRAGNSYSKDAVVSVDTVPPLLVVYINGRPETTTFTATQTALISGMTEASARVVVNGASAARDDLNFTATLALGTGVNPVTVTATDVAGNIAWWLGAVYFDPDPPSLDASVSAENVTPEGLPVTRAATVPVSGSATDALTSVVLFTVNSKEYALDGQGLFYVSFLLDDGDNIIVLTATDLVGNTATRTFHVLRDSVPPTANATLLPGDADLTYIENLAYTRGSTVRLSLVMSEAGVATVQGVTAPVEAGPNAFTIALTEGRNVVGVSFRDRAGNQGPPLSIIVVRDTTAPTIVINAPVPNSVIPGDSVVLEGATEPFATVTVNGQAVSLAASGAFTTRVGIHDGLNTITIAAADLLGNSNTTTIQVSRSAAPLSTGGELGSAGSLLLLAVGLAVGAGVGLLLMRGRGPRGATPTQGAEEGPPPPKAAGPERAAPAPREKGPRGPQRPGA